MKSLAQLIIAIAYVATAQIAIGQEVADQDNAARVKALAQEAAESYSITLKDRAQKVQLVETPVLHWTNPVLGEVYGHIYIWTAGGRPVAAASVHKWFSPRLDSTHELKSLAPIPLSAKGSRGPWVSEDPGLEFRNLPRAVKPAKSPSLRLLQMKQIAREFSARQTRRDGATSEIRLLIQPVYRYTKPDERSDYLDGALFCFAEGNDPEVWLLVEALKETGAWRYALARMNSVHLQVKHRDNEVWQAAELPWGAVLQNKGHFVLLNRPN